MWMTPTKQNSGSTWVDAWVDVNMIDMHDPPSINPVMVTDRAGPAIPKKGAGSSANNEKER